MSENTSNIAEELIDVAEVNRLSESSTIEQPVDIHKHEITKTVEENRDLKRQIVLLEEKVQEKEHNIKILTELVDEDRIMSSCPEETRKSGLVNSTTQVSLLSSFDIHYH